jgi:hypothetical protein
LQLFVSNSELRFLRFVEPAAESGFIGADDAIRRHVLRARRGFSTRELAFGLVVLDMGARHVRSAVGAVARAERACIVALRIAGGAFGRNVVWSKRGSHGDLL